MSDLVLRAEALREAQSSPPARGPLRKPSDDSLGLPPCSKCGNAENNPSAVTRAYCEACERVICRRCIDLGVFGSVSDMQSFVHRRDTRPFYYIERITCPYCQTEPFHTRGRKKVAPKKWWEFWKG